MAEPNQPQFSAPLGGGLAPVAQQAKAVRTEAQAGRLTLDEDVASRLLRELNEVQAEVHGLIAKAHAGLDASLHFGDSFVGRVLGERLQQAAAGPDTAALPVLQQFSEVLLELENTVHKAVETYRTQDEDNADALLEAERKASPEGGY
ncbi:hypothetical protein [Amycolatopsis cihanbeyliensis]|uniref:Uncharacterized protein n=1 Tax=Amycolatopsis cihanbeyliensis TaxID=1128664 RepID=A0A542DMR0_AMYCI|nr:hypothetical protein [Amycolatopsis cihanbeyliensis]TQJ04264.1 hypothetical protein FB471_4048 [Amycolatopsis cihanbeyliensis]